MQEEFLNAKALLEHSSRILLTMHERMDGDDGGALLAVGQMLEQRGKQVTHIIKKGVPPQLQFLPGSEKISAEYVAGDYDLLVTFGCSTKDRCGIEEIITLNIPVLNIDHHQDNSFFGDVNVVDKQKSSVAELVYDFFKFCGWPLNKNIASCLLTGIITDTGSFKHSNTASSTLETSAELMNHGALTSPIIHETFKNKTPEILKAWGIALANSYYDQDRGIIYSVMTELDFKEFTHLPQSAFEGFVETLNSVPEAKFAMFLRQDGNIIKGSLRSDTHKNVDVAKIAQLFGGGGHKQAAGFSIVGKLEKDSTGKWKVV